MNLATIMQGRLTKRASILLGIAGIYLLADEAGAWLAVNAFDMRALIAALLGGEGFKTLMGGVVIYGFRRAMEENPEPEDTPETQDEQMKKLLTELQTIVSQAKKEPKE
jgi:hypothetical protein